jgi:hypothetical protein
LEKVPIVPRLLTPNCAPPNVPVLVTVPMLPVVATYSPVEAAVSAALFDSVASVPPT